MVENMFKLNSVELQILICSHHAIIYASSQEKGYEEMAFKIKSLDVY